MPVIQLENVTKWYWAGRRRRDRHKEIAVADIDLTIEQGDFAFVIGSAGAGKSTLLNLIGGREKPSSGQVLVDGRDLLKMMRKDRRRTRLLFGYVSREGDLIRKENVMGNMWRAARIGRRMFESEEEMYARIRKALGLVGMTGYESKYPGQMTHGECRRVELACALVNSPPILLLDDFTSNLDDDSIWDMFHLIKELNRRGTTIIMATHSSKYVNMMHQRVITLSDGKIAGDVRNGRYGIV